MRTIEISEGRGLIARRDLLRSIGMMGAAAGASFLLNRSIHGGVLMSGEKPISAKAVVDHFILGAADLDQAIAWFEKTTGVKPVKRTTSTCWPKNRVQPVSARSARETDRALVPTGGC